MSERFYINCPLQPGLVILTGTEAHHLATVMRLRPGDAVCLFNGDGHDYPGQIVTVSKRSVEIEVTAVRTVERELPFCLDVAAPLPRGDRAQFLIEKLTELGVTTFTPLTTQRSVVEPREAKLEKLQRHVIEASKQCGRNVLLQVRPLTPWLEWCSSCPSATRLLAHPEKPTLSSSPACFSHLLPSSSLHTQVVVGPEGGLTEAEVELATTIGWRLVNLGPRILRVETAALLLATLVVASWSWSQPATS